MKKRFGVLLILLLCVTVLAGYSRKDALLQETEATLASILSSKLGQKVEARLADCSLLPLPHLVFKDIAIDDAKASSVRIDLSNEALSRGDIIPISIRIADGVVTTRLLHHLLELGEALPKDIRLEVSAMRLVDDLHLPLGSIDIANTPVAVDTGRQCLPFKRQYVCINNTSDKLVFNHGAMGHRDQTY